MKSTNNLNSHHGESSNSRADKMSGIIKRLKKSIKKRFSKTHEDYQEDGKASGKSLKKQYSKKRRQFLKNPRNWDKI